MGRIASLLFLLFLVIALSVFAVANRAVVFLSLPGFDGQIGMPVYLVLFLGILIGVFLVLPVALWTLARRALVLRRERRRAERAEKRLAALEAGQEAARIATARAHIDAAQSKNAARG